MKRLLTMMLMVLLTLIVGLVGCTKEKTEEKTLEEAIEIEDTKEDNIRVEPEKELEELEVEETENQKDALDQKGAAIENDENKDNQETSDGWAMSYEDIAVNLPYQAPSVVAVPQPLSLEEQYQSIINWDQILGFTDGQKAMLKDNGFVVMQPNERWPALKMHVPYETAEYDNLPVFVTSDAVLNMYHMYYSESMKKLEILYYSEDIKELSARLLELVGEAYATADEAVRSELKYVYAYIAIANELGQQSGVYPDEVAVIVEEELSNIDGLELKKSILYGKDVDYSQYIVRGHYTRHDILSDYFRTMMWYSQTGFQLTSSLSDSGSINYEQVARSLMMTHLLFEDEQNIIKWSRVYQMTSLYSGSSDDLNPYNMKTLIEEVYGENKGYKAYIDEQYGEALAEALKKMPKPQINADIGETSPVDMPKGLQYRLMGQRYSLDAEILQELMEPIVRPYPTAFDVLTALGHPVAEEILYDYYITNQEWDGYDAKLAEMKDKASSYNGWQDNLYSGWLWSIDAAAQSFEEYENYPELVTSRAWSLKNLSSALGSYTELKHDNILYSKQAVAEAGGPDIQPVPHYVEPNVELYGRLLWLCDYSLMTIENSGYGETLKIEQLESMRDMLSVLLTVSQKELAGETVSQEEFDEIKWIGGLIDYIHTSMYYDYYQLGIDMSPDDTTALVADIATVLYDGYVEVGTGLPREIYAVCYVNGQSFLARGTVFSFYEFISPKRLSDEDWYEMIGINILEDSGYTRPEFRNEMVSIDHLKTMPWMAAYISSEPNNTEVVWDAVDWNAH